MSRAAIAMTVKGGRFSPMDAYAQEQCAALPDGDYNVRVAKLTRTGREQREGMRGLWWAGCDVLANNVEHPMWDTKRKASDRILEGLGFTRPRHRVDKKIDLIPVSLADDAMDDEEFAVLQERARPFVIDRWGFDPWEMWTAEQDAMKGNKR